MAQRLFEGVDSFVGSKNSRKTQEAYRRSILMFGEMKFGEIDRGAMIRKLDGYIRKADLQAIMTDIQAFKNYLGTKKLAIRSSRLYIAALQSWFSNNQLQIPKNKSKELRGRIKPTTDDKAFTLETAKMVLDQMKSPVSRSFFFFLLSTGARMGEALQVKLSNVDWKAKPVTVWLDESITKTGEGRHVFLTSEAAEFIRKVWLTPTDDDGVVLSNRERFMRAAMNKGKGLGITRPRIEIDDRVWPFESPTAHKFISTAIRRAGYNAKTKTGLSQLHPHSTRKFFRTIFGRAAGPDAAEEIMGHAGYLTGSYRKTERDELAAIFLKHESALHINLTPEARHAMETRDLHAAAIVQLQQQNKRLVKDMEIMKRIINRGSEVEKS